MRRCATASRNVVFEAMFVVVLKGRCGGVICCVCSSERAGERRGRSPVVVLLVKTEDLNNDDAAAVELFCIFLSTSTRKRQRVSSTIKYSPFYDILAARLLRFPVARRLLTRRR